MYIIECTYSWLSWDTGGNNDNIGTSESLGQSIIRGKVSDYLGRGRDVGQICSDTGRVDDIVQTELSQRT
jgi:hypothetical protein